jgi:hypothetical protein
MAPRSKQTASSVRAFCDDVRKQRSVDLKKIENEVKDTREWLAKAIEVSVSLMCAMNEKYTFLTPAFVSQVAQSSYSS